MGDCCNAKTLSYVSAGLQIFASVFVFLFITSFAAAVSRKDLELIFGSVKVATTAFVIIGAICLINLALLVTLIMGIKQKRITLVKIYIYPIIVMMALYALEICASFILGFVNQRPVGAVFGKFILDWLNFGLNLLIILPIFVHFKGMRGNRNMSVQYGFFNNQPNQDSEYSV